MYIHTCIWFTSKILSLLLLLYVGMGKLGACAPVSNIVTEKGGGGWGLE